MTAQVSDVLCIEGYRRPLICEPLFGWLCRKKNRALRFRRRTTACSRGYVAEWTVFNGRLFLTKMHAQWRDGGDVAIEDLFTNYSPQYFESVSAHHPENAGPGQFAFWVDGLIACRLGKLLGYQHSGSSSIYERTLELRIRDGFLVGQRLIENEAPSPEFDLEEDLEDIDELL